MRYILILSMLVSGILLSACGASASSTGAKDAVEAYVNAIARNDANSLSTLSCANWEPQAQTELDSFQAVKITLQGLACQQTGTNDGKALVNCKGKMILSYNNENQELDLSTRTYQVVEQNGNWLVCGVQ